MFFARLAIAALSLGSVVTVLAAPIELPSNVAIRGTLSVSRDVLPVMEAITNAKVTVESARSELDNIVASPGATAASQVETLLAGVATSMGQLTESLKSIDPTEDNLLEEVCNTARPAYGDIDPRVRKIAKNVFGLTTVMRTNLPLDVPPSFFSGLIANIETLKTLSIIGATNQALFDFVLTYLKAI